MKTKVLAVALCAALLSVPSLGQGCGLTTLPANNGCNGVFMDLIATNPAGVDIQNFETDLNTGTNQVSIYAVTGGGSYAGLETNPAAWTLVFSGSVTGVTGNWDTIPNLTTPVHIPAGMTQGFYIHSGSPGGIRYTNHSSTVGTLAFSDSNLQLMHGLTTCDSTVFLSSPTLTRNFSGVINYSYPGQVIDWQTNPSFGGINFDGGQATICASNTINAAIYNGCAAPSDHTFNFSTTMIPGSYDLVFSASPLVPASAGGLVVPGAGIVNLDLSQPISLLGLTNVPTGGFPGSTSFSYSVALSLTTPQVFSVQGYFMDPASPIGLTLTQAGELNVALLPPATSIAGPTTTTANVSVDTQSGETCWTTSGVPFYGTNFNEIHVCANGFISFGGTDTDTTPSIADSMNDDGRVGFWTNLDPSEGGNITINSPATDLIRVDWNNVSYDALAGAAGVTYSIEIDCTTGVISMTGLNGIMANPGTSTTDDQWMGISPGITPGLTGIAGTTDPGAAGFALGGGGFAAADGDMLYEFNDVSVSLSGVPASVAGGMSTLIFSPLPVGAASNYSWNGF